MNQDIHVLVEHLRGHVLDITYMMLAAAHTLAQSTGGKVIALLLGHEEDNLSVNLNADHVYCYDHALLAEFTPETYLRVLTQHINNEPPRALLMGHTTIGMDVASVLSARANLPLISQCQKFKAADDRTAFVSQICGGKLMAEGYLTDTTTIITTVPGGYKPEEGQTTTPPPIIEKQLPNLDGLKIQLKKYIEPEISDVDISKEKVLVSVGRGLQNKDDLALIGKLAKSLNGAVSSSRPIVDKGWLQTARLVGKSGKQVKPKLYLAMGISGAPEHVEAITGSEMIIAINTDPNAPIFDKAKYGANVDMMELIPALIEHLEQAKVG